MIRGNIRMKKYILILSLLTFLATPLISSTSFAFEYYDHEGFDLNGYDKNGFDKKGFDKKGLDITGHNEEGYDEFGYDAWGRTKEEAEKEKKEKEERARKEKLEKYLEAKKDWHEFIKKTTGKNPKKAKELTTEELARKLFGPNCRGKKISKEDIHKASGKALSRIHPDKLRATKTYTKEKYEKANELYKLAQGSLLETIVTELKKRADLTDTSFIEYDHHLRKSFLKINNAKRCEYNYRYGRRQYDCKY